jgi:hypothetical protein
LQNVEEVVGAWLVEAMENIVRDELEMGAMCARLGAPTKRKITCPGPEKYVGRPCTSFHAVATNTQRALTANAGKLSNEVSEKQAP